MSVAGRRAIVYGAIAVAVMTALRATLSLRGYLYLDDFAFRYWAATQPFGTQYLWQSYGGHVNPVGLAVQWVLQAIYPGSHLALAIFAICCFGASLALFGAILWRLTHAVSAVLLGIVLAGISLFTFEVTVWWAAAIYAAPYQVFLLGCLYAVVARIQSGGRLWALLAVVGAIGAGLSFSRGVIGLLLVYALAASLPLNQGKALGLGKAFAVARTMWLSIAAVGLSIALLVVRSAGEITASGFSAGQLPGYGWRLLVLNILPAVWGGPWRWFELPLQEWSPVLANPAPMWWAVWLCVAITVVSMIAIWVHRRELRSLLVVVICYVFLVIVIAGIARSGTLTATVAYRYTFDLVWPITLLVVLSVVPATQLTRRVWRPGVAILSAVAVLGCWSTIVPARGWAQNPSQQYVANAVAGFARISPEQGVLDQGVPFDLIHSGFMAQYANTRTVLVPQPGAPVFAPYAEGELFGFGADGSVETNDVVGPGALEGPDPECGYAVTDIPRTIPLDGRLIPWEFFARVAYFSGTDTTLNVAFGGQSHSVPLRAGGLRVVYFPVSGPGEDVLVSVGTPGVTSCITDLRIGNRVSEATGDPVPLPITELGR